MLVFPLDDICTNPILYELDAAHHKTSYMSSTTNAVSLGPQHANNGYDPVEIFSGTAGNNTHETI